MTDALPPAPGIEQKISLFASAAYEQFISSEKEEGRPFDNTLDMTPDMHFALRLAQEPAELYIEYLRFKFATLRHMENGRTVDELIAEYFGLPEIGKSTNALRLKESMASFIPSERNAYLARLSQLPKVVVAKKHYFDDDTFHTWSQLIEEKYLWYEQAFDGKDKSRIESKLIQLYEDRDIGFVDEVNLEYYERTRISVAARKQRTLFVQLRERRLVSSDAEESELLPSREKHILYLDKESQATVRGIVSQIASATWAQEESPTLFEFMQVVVDQIVHHYACRFADFLSFDAQGQILLFTASSLKPTEEELEKAGAHLHYRVGQGISGSVCYLDQQADARWVGTNDLAHDPRASRFHLVAPNTHQLYGPVSDYWLFPIFALDRPDQLRGALRVINKSRKPDAGGPAWSLVEKLEIAEIARTLELFLPLFPADEAIETTRGEGLNAKAAATIIRKLWEADWIDKTFCRTLVSHLMQVALRKVEDYSLGCTICVVKSDYIDNVMSILLPYPPAGGLARGTDLQALMDVYSFVHPAAATFVFTEYGEFVGCRELRSQEHPNDPLALMRSLVLRFRSPINSSIMFFVLNRGSKTIRIYGENDGDIYLREDTGYWVARNYQDLLDHLRPVSEANVNFKLHTIELTFARAWQLSLERTGAILVIANSYPKAITQQTILSLPINLDACPAVTFSDLARRDGAVWINWSAMIERIGVIVGSLSTDHIDSTTERPGAARHAAARAISKEVPNSLVFAISHNGGISAFFSGKELFYRL